MWIQDPNYAPVVCFNYYWNCDDYVNNTCYNKTSDVVFGDDNCYDAQEYASGFSTGTDTWAIDVTVYEFDDYKSKTEFSAYLSSSQPYVSIDYDLWNETQ